jgi:hypothetical protein
MKLSVAEDEPRPRPDRSAELRARRAALAGSAKTEEASPPAPEPEPEPVPVAQAAPTSGVRPVRIKAMVVRRISQNYNSTEYSAGGEYEVPADANVAEVFASVFDDLRSHVRRQFVITKG